MNCTKCKNEIPDDSKYCFNCGEKVNLKSQTFIEPTTNTKKKNSTKREGITIGGIVVPTFFISIFCIILGFGGYISPLLLLSAVLLLAKVKSKSLTHNIAVILAIYGAQFIIETALTFLASIPAKLLAWLSSIAASNIDFVTTMGNISTGLENVFAVMTNFIGISFFAIYIVCILSLCKSDKIKLPFVSDYLNTVFSSTIVSDVSTETEINDDVENNTNSTDTEKDVSNTADTVLKDSQTTTKNDTINADSISQIFFDAFKQNNENEEVVLLNKETTIDNNDNKISENNEDIVDTDASAEIKDNENLSKTPSDNQQEKPKSKNRRKPKKRADKKKSSAEIKS